MYVQVHIYPFALFTLSSLYRLTQKMKKKIFNRFSFIRVYSVKDLMAPTKNHNVRTKAPDENRTSVKRFHPRDYSVPLHVNKYDVNVNNPLGPTVFCPRLTSKKFTPFDRGTNGWMKCEKNFSKESFLNLLSLI